MASFLTPCRLVGRYLFLSALAVDAYRLAHDLLRGHPVLGGVLLAVGIVAAWVGVRAGKQRRAGR